MSGNYIPGDKKKTCNFFFFIVVNHGIFFSLHIYDCDVAKFY